jgi:hypothetical protein
MMGTSELPAMLCIRSEGPFEVVKVGEVTNDVKSGS